MANNQFFDVHTHSKENTLKKAAVYNFYKDFHLVKNYPYCSVGLHPWYIDANWETTWNIIESTANQLNVIAIGETGLDKIVATPLQQQLKVFALHVQLANQLQKPLIIHCVRAFNEVVQQLTILQNKVPVIFHGFNKSVALAQNLIQQGFYISFGKAITKYAVGELSILPLSNIFVETDDAAISIEKMYDLAAYHFNIDVNVFSLHIQQNATAVFGKNIDWV